MISIEKQAHTVANISLFIQVKNLKVQKKFIWLRENNIFYKNIEINYTFIDKIDDIFIPTNIIYQILEYCLNLD